MRKTTNYGLTLYDKEDKMVITAEENSLNNNMELIDSALKEKTTIQDMTNYIEEHKEELKGTDGKDGKDGVYIGTTEPTDANVWIDPTGEADDLATKNYVDGAVNGLVTKSYVDEAIGDIETLLGGI